MSSLDARTAAQWRAWLGAHGRSEPEVWLIIHHKDQGVSELRYQEAIEHALCFGWIDGLHRRRDAHSSQLRFTPRRPASTWSAVNRRRATTMIERGLMTEHGQAVIDAAKASGRWEPVSEAEAFTVPVDLRSRFAADDEARRHFEAFPPSSKRLILEWIAGAKKPETRTRRIERTVDLAAQNQRANHPGTRTQVAMRAAAGNAHRNGRARRSWQQL